MTVFVHSDTSKDRAAAVPLAEGVSAPTKFRSRLFTKYVVLFVAVVVALSFSSVGVPNGGSAFKTLPAYLAAGLPVICSTLDVI